jgi:GAF domain-containing protein
VAENSAPIRPSQRDVFEAPADGSFDRIARMAAAVFHTPISTVSIVDTDRVWFAAAQGLDGVTQVGTEPGLCASAVLADGPYIVNDATLDSRTLTHPLVIGEFGLRFYAAAPIVTADGHPLGTVTVIDREPRMPDTLTDIQISLLTELAGAVSDLIEIKLAALTALRAERAIQAAEAARTADAHRLAEQIRSALGAQRGFERPEHCQLGGQQECPNPVELKVADSWGDSAWGCYDHAEEALVNVPSVFLASESGQGLAAYMARRPPAPLSQ